jgi:hypothetical protein
MEVLGTINKLPFTELPFVKYLFIGANNQSYWNLFYMSLHLEDVVDCLQVFYPKFDLVFLFDHSQGHVQILRRSATKDERDGNIGKEGFLGPHLPELRVTDTQSMIYLADDSGPWYLTPNQRALQRHGRPTGKTKLVERSKKQLLETLKERRTSRFCT